MHLSFKTILPAIGILCLGCKKILQIPAPIGNITTSQVFSSNTQAGYAVSGMYFNMINSGQLSYANSGLTVFGGLSADEFILFDQTNTNVEQFQQNKLLPTNNYINTQLWSSTYSTIYIANSIIQGLTNYSGVSDSISNELTGEAEFIRAFCHFYLINLFGNVPIVTTIDWHKTNLLSRSTSDAVYAQIVSDLLDAKARLATDFSAGGGQRSQRLASLRDRRMLW